MPGCDKNTGPWRSSAMSCLRPMQIPSGSTHDTEDGSSRRRIRIGKPRPGWCRGKNLYWGYRKGRRRRLRFRWHDGALGSVSYLDPEQAPFGSFSRVYIEGAVKRAVRNNEAPEISYGDFCSQPKVTQAKEALEARGADASDLEAVAEEAGVTKTLVERVSRSAQVLWMLR